MTFRQTIQGLGINFYADGNIKAPEQYYYKPFQFNQLVDAWMPLVQQANIKFPPIFNILAVEAACSGPLLGLMNQNRKMRKQIEAMSRKMAQMEKDVAVAVSARKPTKTQWKVDKNGYFEYTPANTYIAIEDRTEKPEMTDENYKLLVDANGPDHIHKVFNLKAKA